MFENKSHARIGKRVLSFTAFFGVLLLLAWAAAPHTTAAAKQLSPEQVLNADGTIDLRTGLSGSIDLRGWTVTIDRTRGPILARVGGGDRSQSAASNSPQSLGWTRLFHQSVTGGVNAIAIIGSDIYIGGNFQFLVDDGVTIAHQIAKYSGGVWSALAHTGLNASVNALAVVGTDLYVGGYFDNTWDLIVSLASIARYDTVGGTWAALSNNGILSGPVLALATIGNNLYVGGAISGYSPGSFVADMNGIAVYNTSGGTWSALPHRGLQGQVQALAVSGSDLYVGGQFSGNGDATGASLNNIAEYNGATWSALAHNGLNQIVQSLAISGTELYAGGQFTQTFDSGVGNLNLIAKYDTSGSGTWSALAHNGLKGTNVPGVRSLAVIGNDLYVGGRFSASFDNAVLNLNNVARYDNSGGAWSALPNQGLSSDVFVLKVIGADLYVGGDFGGTFDGQYVGQFAKLGAAPSYDVYLPLIIK